MLKMLIVMVILLSASIVNAGEIEGIAANEIVRKGKIIGSAQSKSQAVWQLLIQYKRELYSCMVVFNDSGIDVRFCWTSEN